MPYLSPILVHRHGGRVVLPKPSSRPERVRSGATAYRANTLLIRTGAALPRIVEEPARASVTWFGLVLDVGRC